MLKDVVNQFEKIYLATGYTDLRRGIDGLATTIHQEFNLDPFNKDILFLFCGRRSDRIKGLLWEGDGFLLLYMMILVNLGQRSYNSRTKFRKYTDSVLILFGQEHCPKGTS